VQRDGGGGELRDNLPSRIQRFEPCVRGIGDQGSRTARFAQQQQSRAAGTVPPRFGPNRLQTQFAAALGGCPAQHSDGVQRSDDIKSSSPGEQQQDRGPSDPIQQSSSGPRTGQPDRGPDSEGQIEQRTPIQRDFKV
jgi:hypothetical protein